MKVGHENQSKTENQPTAEPVNKTLHDQVKK